MSEVAKHVKSELAISENQTEFTPEQRTALAHMGLDEVSEADLDIYLHQIKRTGLDPFVRQIHMVGRNSYNPSSKKWEKKYTIQTGIDGYRLIGHRTAEERGETIEVPQAEWMDDNGAWRPAWSKRWGTPVAARSTVIRNGKPFTAIANFDEYAQTKKDGSLNQMWGQRPAGQIAKCAEALAWRMAFPQDLAGGLYTDEEMGQADNQPVEPSVEPELDYQGIIANAWDNREQLGELGSWASKNGWPTEHVQAIRDRWTELNNQKPEDTKTETEVLEGEVIQ